MIVFRETKLWQTNSIFPEENYSGLPDSEVWVVKDNSELAEKIKSLGTRWNPVVDEDGFLTDVEWDGTEKPEVVPVPTAQDDTDAMLVDHEYRLTLLELGVTEGV